MNANIGDIVVLENGLKMKLVFESSDHCKTIDIKDGSDCTTGININNLKDYSVGCIVYGHGLSESKIVDIIKPTYSKPPLGVMPRSIFELQRAQDICRALYECICYEKPNYKLMIKWCNELSDRLYAINSENE